MTSLSDLDAGQLLIDLGNERKALIDYYCNSHLCIDKVACPERTASIHSITESHPIVVLKTQQQVDEFNARRNRINSIITAVKDAMPEFAIKNKAILTEIDSPLELVTSITLNSERAISSSFIEYDKFIELLEKKKRVVLRNIEKHKFGSLTRNALDDDLWDIKHDLDWIKSKQAAKHGLRQRREGYETLRPYIHFEDEPNKHKLRVKLEGLFINGSGRNIAVHKSQSRTKPRNDSLEALGVHPLPFLFNASQQNTYYLQSAIDAAEDKKQEVKYAESQTKTITNKKIAKELETRNKYLNTQLAAVTQKIVNNKVKQEEFLQTMASASDAVKPILQAELDKLISERKELEQSVESIKNVITNNNQRALKLTI